MAARLRARWLDLVDGFWFVPAAVALAYVFLALGLIAIDRSGGDGGVDAAFGGDAEAARGILSTIAGSLITVAGLTFSLTIVVLTLVSSQFSTRVVRNLLADRVNQIVAGSFTGLFAFCLIVLRTVRDPQPPEPEFVPALSVSVSIVLALFSLALLLVFIHHMGTSIQAPQIAARVGRATLAAIEQLYPEPYGHAVETKGEPGDPRSLADERPPRGRRRAAAPRVSRRQGARPATGCGVRHPSARGRRAQGALAGNQRSDHRRDVRLVPPRRTGGDCGPCEPVRCPPRPGVRHRARHAAFHV